MLDKISSSDFKRFPRKDSCELYGYGFEYECPAKVYYGFRRLTLLVSNRDYARFMFEFGNEPRQPQSYPRSSFSTSVANPNNRSLAILTCQIAKNDNGAKQYELGSVSVEDYAPGTRLNTPGYEGISISRFKSFLTDLLSGVDSRSSIAIRMLDHIEHNKNFACLDSFYEKSFLMAESDLALDQLKFMYPWFFKGRYGELFPQFVLRIRAFLSDTQI